MPKTIASRLLNTLANFVGLGSDEKDETNNENRTVPRLVTSSSSSTTSLEIGGNHIRDNSHLGDGIAVGSCATVGTDTEIFLEDAVVNEPFRDNSHLGFSNAVGPCTVVGTDQILRDNVDEGCRRSKRRHAVEIIYGTVAKKFKYIKIDDKNFRVRVHWTDAPSHQYNDLSEKDFDSLNISQSSRVKAMQMFMVQGNNASYTKLVGDISVRTFRTRISNTYVSADKYCLPYAVFNPIQVPVYKETHDKVLDLFGSTHGSLQILAKAVNHLGIGIRAIKELECRSLISIDWILSRTQGIYIVVTDLHAFSVDIQRQLVFDCAYPLSFKLCRESLEFCLDRDSIRAIREIRLPKYLLPRS